MLGRIGAVVEVGISTGYPGVFQGSPHSRVRIFLREYGDLAGSRTEIVAGLHLKLYSIDVLLYLIQFYKPTIILQLLR